MIKNTENQFKLGELLLVILLLKKAIWVVDNGTIYTRSFKVYYQSIIILKIWVRVFDTEINKFSMSKLSTRNTHYENKLIEGKIFCCKIKLLVPNIDWKCKIC